MAPNARRRLVVHPLLGFPRCRSLTPADVPSALNSVFLFKRQLAVVALLCGYMISAATLVDEYRQPPNKWPLAQVDESVNPVELGSPHKPKNPDWQTAASEKLGRMLFFDPRLSGSRQIACVSCHDSQHGWTDGRRFSAGHDRQSGTRNSMSLLNVAYVENLFWDGRAESLLDLIPRPIESHIEMNADIADVAEELASLDGYPEAFASAFDSEEITCERMAMAIASFLRTIYSSKSRFDHFVGGDYNALTDKEIQGLHLFRTKARCMNCHHGPLMTDGEFHHTGLSYYGRRFEDLGRFNHTGKQEDRGKFRTPSLRDAQFTGPWMHNGLFTNFSGILRLYNHGVTFNSSVRYREGSPPLSPLIQPLGLTDQELEALEAFLHSVSRIPRHVFEPELPQLTQVSANGSDNPSRTATSTATREE